MRASSLTPLFDMTTTPATIRLIAGLGNPGASYADTRHNVGFWWTDELARSHGGRLQPDLKLGGNTLRLTLAGDARWLLQPMNFMNRSGQAIGALARYYKIAPEEVMVIHDDLDLPPGTVRLKRGGGHGGHNGLRDTIAHLNSKEFLRLRLGIGHPGTAAQVHDYVLGRPSVADRVAIEAAMEASYQVLDRILTGDLQKAMNELHRRS